MIRRLSVNYVKNYFNQIPINRYKRYRCENFNEMERKIRTKILKANEIKEDIEIKKNLKKIKTEITQKLFEELSKKLSNDIEEGERNYNYKINIEFNAEFMIKEKNEYIKNADKKSGKILKKLKKINYMSKHKLIQIYEKNISNYSKINIYESNYLFFKYLLYDYFNYINFIIFGENNNYHEIEIKAYNLLHIYNININNIKNNFCSLINKKNEYYCHSIFLQYLLMEKDKIQKYSINIKYIDKTIKQIENLIKQANEKINDLKNDGDIKINFNINGNETEENNAINNINLPNRNKNKYSTMINIKKTEYSDTDKYDSKSGYDTRGIYPGKIKFNYKTKNNNNKDNEIIITNNNNNNINNNVNNNNINDNINNNNVSNKTNLLKKRKTFNNELFHSTYSNFLNNNNSNNTLNNIINNTKLETMKNIEKKYNFAIINKDKIEKKYKHNITKNNDYFFKRKKAIKTKKHHEIITPKKDINFLKGNYMFKNMLDYRTDEIKTKIKKNIKSPVEMLFYQIKEHDFDEFCDLFERKQIDLNARNPDNDSFLIYAAKCKAINFVQYLLKRGIDVNLENKYGNTALHYAFSDQNYELADILLQHGADEFKINTFGLTPWQCLGDKKI